MKPELECAPCLHIWLYERAGVLTDHETCFQLSRSILRILSEEFRSDVNLALLANKTIEPIEEYVVQSSQYYNPFKLKSNQHARELLPEAKNFIDQGKTEQERLIRACCLASVSNIAPIGGPSGSFKFQEVIDLLAEKKPLPVVRGNVFEAIKTAKKIFYITDNAGEIGFDGLLISQLKEMGKEITLLVKEDPFFEDATITDVTFFNLDHLVDHLYTVKGLFVPTQTPSPLMEAFNQSDLILSKGTGNFEALYEEVNQKPVIYMLKVKCRPISQRVGVEMGTFLVKG